jgi:hypothetical protein
MRIAKHLLEIAGSILVLLGALHALYTSLDIRRPRRLVPLDPTVALAMTASPLRLSRGGTTMWRAWVGFNFSHSVGVVLFGEICVGAGAAPGAMVVPPWMLLALAFISAIYLGLSARYWFWAPTTGIATASLCVLLAWLVYAWVGV